MSGIELHEEQEQPLPIIGAARNCLRILYSFVGLPKEVSLGRLSETTGLNKSTTYRALQTLMAEGFVEQNPDSRKYRLGVCAFEVGAEYMRTIDLRDACTPVLQKLVDELRQTATLAVPNRSGIIFIDKAQSSFPAAFFCDLGRRLPLHTGAAAKSILAWLPQDVIERYIAQRLSRLTPYTIVSPDRLDQELSHIRHNGYSVSHQEVDISISAVGAPIFDADGCVTAGIAVAGLSLRFTPPFVQECAQAVVAGAREISRSLGCRSTPDPANVSSTGRKT